MYSVATASVALQIAALALSYAQSLAGIREHYAPMFVFLFAAASTDDEQVVPRLAAACVLVMFYRRALGPAR
jgi:hypothetical protein